MTLSQLEEEAKKRKERLQLWKLNQNQKRKDFDDDEDQNENKEKIAEEQNQVEREEKIEFPKPIFRNYKPKESGPLSGAILLPRPKLVDVKALIDQQLKGNSFSLSSPTTTTGESNSMTQMVEDVDLLSLAPRKADSDLKRDVEKKMKRLEKRTTKSIAELTRQRLLNDQQQENASNLAEVVATTSKINEHLPDDDDDD